MPNQSDNGAAPETSDDEVQELDLTQDRAEAAGSRADGAGRQPAEVIERETYNPKRHEDRARRNIAYLLIALLFLVCIFAFVGVITGWLSLDDSIELLQLILSPVVALVSAATGFYFGANARSDDPSQPPG